MAAPGRFKSENMRQSYLIFSTFECYFYFLNYLQQFTVHFVVGVEVPFKEAHWSSGWASKRVQNFNLSKIVRSESWFFSTKLLSALPGCFDRNFSPLRCINALAVEETSR